MHKSAYSLILMDDVVAEIDRIAQEEGTNRSNLINQVLADFVSLTTPEKRINDIFNQIGSLLSGDIFSPYIEPHERTMSLKSSLEYKYRPTIRYEVELYHTPQKAIGELKVIFRSQSIQLLLELTTFFKLWVQLENTYLSPFYPPNSISYKLEEGKFYRTFIVPKGKSYSQEDLGNAISGYIKMFDEILKSYLSGSFSSTEALENRYLSYLNRGLGII